jgi:methionine sulfoxide reductase catalytic subunit
VGPDSRRRHPIEQMGYHLTMMAYDMNDEPLAFGHGAPLGIA